MTIRLCGCIACSGMMADYAVDCMVVERQQRQATMRLMDAIETLDVETQGIMDDDERTVHDGQEDEQEDW